MVEREPVTEFGGVAGRVLVRCVSAGSTVSGLVLFLVLLVGAWVCAVAGTPRAVTPFTQIVLALGLARFAVNGQYGEWGGSVFSSRGGPWSVVAIVAARYLALTSLWLIPLILVGFAPEQAMGAITGIAMGMGGWKVLVLLFLYVLLATLTPPIFLIVSVSATGFGDLFAPSHWRGIFSGRGGDAFLLYCIYVGGMGMLMLLAVPATALAFLLGKAPGLVVLLANSALLFGVSINLLGRLCGFYACGDLGLHLPSAARAADAGPAVSARAPVAPREARAAEPAAPSPIPVSVPLSAEPPRPKLPPLMDAPSRVGEILRRTGPDSAAAIKALEELERTFLPSPHVLAGLAIALHRAGKIDEGIAKAHQALPLTFEHGHLALAAGIVRQFLPQLERLELGRDRLLSVAAALAKSDDLQGAAKAYAALVTSDPGDTRATKGLLGVADELLHRKARPDAAAKIYRFLVQRCPASPLSEYFTRGLEETERRAPAPPPASPSPSSPPPPR